MEQAGIAREHPRSAVFGALYGAIHGLPRHLGQHSGGMVICQGQLDSVVPLEPATMPGRVVVQWDKDDCADMGIIKVDLLGLGMMAVIEDTLKLKSGETILIQGGAGGVAGFAIQLAKHIGARVITTTSTGNLGFVRDLGADEVIDYRTQDFATMLHDYDVVLDPLSGETLEKSVRVVRPGGLVIGSTDRPTRHSPVSSASAIVGRGSPPQGAPAGSGSSEDANASALYCSSSSG